MRRLAILLFACCALQAQSALTLERAEVAYIAVRDVPDNLWDWKPATLPHPWFGRTPALGAVAWYRIPFELPKDGHRGYLLYVPRVTVAAMDFYLNGQPLAWHTDFAPHDAPIVPLVARVPAELLRDGENVLHVRVRASPAWLQGMPRVHIGKARELGPQIRYWRLLQVEVIVIFAFAIGLIGVLSLALWAVDRSDVMLWYGITGVAFGAVTAVWYVSAGSATFANWMTSLVFLRFHGLITPLAIVNLRLAGWRLPWLEGVLWLLLAVAAIGIALPDQEVRYRAWTGFGLFYSFLPLLFLIPIARAKQAMRPISRAGLSFASVGAAALSLHDWAVRAGLLDFDRPWLIHYVVPFVMIAIGAVIIEQFFSAARRQRELNVELEARVVQKSREIEAAHAQMRAADEERALVRERRRIMADMHDGLGSRLVGLLSQVQSGRFEARELEQGLAAALEELRTTIDSLQPVEGDLGVVLGNVRHRMRSVFDTAGVQLGWHVGELPRLESLTPARNLAIQRILLELFTNVLKHSGARKVAVSTAAGAGRASIVIEDDGRGFVVGNHGNGRGMWNLQERAREAGGTLVIESEPGQGTRATLALPAAA